MDAVIQAIQSLGFPVACVCAMFMMWQKEVKSHDEEMDNLRNTLAEQTERMTAALNGNTLVLTKILTKLGEDE